MDDDGLPTIDREVCNDCGECTAVCNAEALVVVGRRLGLAELMGEIRKDLAFYRRSGGGVTLGGGEVLLWAPFALLVLEACKAEGINTVAETCGYGDWPALESLIPHVDLFYYDLKHIDPEVHEQLTGVDNAPILANLSRLTRAGANVTVRIPVIPGHTDDVGNICAIAQLARAGDHVTRVELLPYHQLGEEKYAHLGIDYSLKGLRPPSAETMKRLVDVCEREGLQCRVGG